MGNSSSGRKEHSEKMFALVSKWWESGQSRAKYSESCGISVAVFNYWLRQSPKEGSILGESSGKFIGLQVGNDGGDGVSLVAKIELDYPNGVRLRVHGLVSSDWVKSLIH